MSRPYFSSMVLLSLSLLVLRAPAQTTDDPATQPAPATKQTATSKDRSEANAEAERIAKERRAQARALLLSLASDARSFHDQTLRARTLARIADALWDTDVERGRELFRKAWEAAESADQETAQKLQEEIRRQTVATGGGYAIPAHPDIRREVLRLVSRRDRELTEEFLQNLKADQQQGLEGGNQRLSLARELLVTGEEESALRFAASELSTINLFTVDFLSLLRERNAVAADERYRNLLNIAARNALADSDTVSLLASYIFTPHSYVMFNGGGTSYGSMPGDNTRANVAPDLLLTFFQTAQAILLRTPAGSQPDQIAADTVGKYLVLKRLLFFLQDAPREIADTMRQRFETLGNMVGEADRQRNVHQVQIAPENYHPEQDIKDKIEHARTSAERDRLYFELAEMALYNDDVRARDLVGKIEDGEFRKQASAYIDATLAARSIHGKEIGLGLELVRKGELTHIQRVWLLTQLAKLLAKTDHEKSLSLLEDAVPEARRIEGLDPDRPRALLAIANALKLVDPWRTRDSVFEAVKAANSADGFTGEDGNLNILFQTRGFSSVNDMREPDFDLKGIFGLLAKDDYDQAVELARGFQGEAPRAAAVIAIARAVLNERVAPVPTPRRPNKN